MISPSSRQALMSKKSTSSFLERTRFTAMPKEHTGTPARVKRSSGSRVRLPPKTTRLKLTMSISLLRKYLALVRSWPLVSDYTRGKVFPTGSLPWWALKQIFLRGYLRRSYSPQRLEGKFCELRVDGVLGSPHSPGPFGPGRSLSVGRAGFVSTLSQGRRVLPRLRTGGAYVH